MAKTYAIERCERRIPMEVAVQVGGHPQVPGVEMTFTENVSSRGARVLSSRRWRTNDRLFLASLPGDFRAAARVAYCHAVPGEGYAVGLEFQQPQGRWVLTPSEASAA
jgi:hypothetical protein